MSQVVTDADFEAEVLKSELPVLVDFFAEWCGPCKMLGPVIDELATEHEGKWKIVKCDVDNAPEISQKYQVTSIPTLLFFKGGEVVDKLMGFKPKDDIADKLV